MPAPPAYTTTTLPDASATGWFPMVPNPPDGDLPGPHVSPPLVDVLTLARFDWVATSQAV